MTLMNVYIYIKGSLTKSLIRPFIDLLFSYQQKQERNLFCMVIFADKHVHRQE